MANWRQEIEAMFVELDTDEYDGKHEKVLEIIKALTCPS
jgi:hypothetical protein